ncbi:MAG TPA: DUF1003 domain-containing protein [Oceanobacillus sp.]|nr:DUF1003 domain-containing protein [Oceanobacillus sp.]
MQNSQKHNMLKTLLGDTAPQAESRKQIAQSIKAKMDAKRTYAERLADWLTLRFGSMQFLIANLIWFVVWIVLNIGVIPGVQPFDPFPFGFLTMIVSLEAIVLAIVVLISQNREAQVAALREEIDVYINLQAEQKLTKLLEMAALLLEKQGIATNNDGVLQTMLKEENVDEIERKIEDELKTD